VSERDVETVRQQFELVDRGEGIKAIDAWAEDIVLNVAADFGGGTFRGREAAAGWFASWYGAYRPGYRLEIEDPFEVAGRFVVVNHHRGVGRSSGAPTEGTWVNVYELRDGLIARTDIHQDLDAALAALQASAPDDPSLPVRRIYARFVGRQNALELLAEDVVFDFSRRQVEAEVYYGHEGVLRFIRQLLEGWSELRTEPSQFISAGDRVLVLLTLRTSGRSTGLEVVEQIAHVWTVTEGRVTRLEYFGDAAEARRAIKQMPERG
jgi:ketosteroid isomerase-like protein